MNIRSIFRKHKNAFALTLALMIFLVLLVLHIPKKQTGRLYLPIYREETGGVRIHQGVALIDINRAPENLLTTLPGIGEKLARAIVEYRETNGPFESPESLTLVSGIGPAKLKNILPQITCG